MKKELTAEESAQLLEYRRAQRRAYWERKTPEQRKEMRKKAQSNFWGRMTAEERKAKRAEYDLQRAKRAAAKAAANTDA